MNKYFMVTFPLVCYALTCWVGYGSFMGHADASAFLGNVFMGIIGNLGIGIITVVGMEAMIITIALLGVQVSFLNSGVSVNSMSLRAVIMTVPFVLVYSLLFAGALPVFVLFPLGIGLLLNAFFALMFTIGLMGMMSYG